MNEIKIDLLSFENVISYKGIDNRFEMFKKQPDIVEGSGTDLTLITGAFVDSSGKNICYWINPGNVNNRALCVSGKRTYWIDSADSKSNSIRPVLKISMSLFSSIYKNSTINSNGIPEINFLEYPQFAASAELQNVLNRNKKILKKTGNSYTIYISEDEFNIYDEYEYQGKKYICVDVYFFGLGYTLSNGLDYLDGDSVWLEVSPIKWLLDKKNNCLVSNYCLLSGIVYDKEGSFNALFKDTFMYNFLNNHMLPDMLQSFSDYSRSFLSLDDLSFFEDMVDKISPEDRDAYLMVLNSLKNNFKKR